MQKLLLRKRPFTIGTPRTSKVTSLLWRQSRTPNPLFCRTPLLSSATASIVTRFSHTLRPLKSRPPRPLLPTAMLHRRRLVRLLLTPVPPSHHMPPFWWPNLPSRANRSQYAQPGRLLLDVQVKFQGLRVQSFLRLECKLSWRRSKWRG